MIGTAPPIGMEAGTPVIVKNPLPAPLVRTSVMSSTALPSLVKISVLVHAVPLTSGPIAVPFARLAASPLAIGAPFVPKTLRLGSTPSHRSSAPLSPSRQPASGDTAKEE